MAAAKASIGHSEPVSGQAGLQRLATALGRLAAGGNAQLRQLNPLVNERWKDAAAALSTQQAHAAGGGRHPDPSSNDSPILYSSQSTRLDPNRYPYPVSYTHLTLPTICSV